jgi:ammonia channel protein AmtB
MNRAQRTTHQRLWPAYAATIAAIIVGSMAERSRVQAASAAPIHQTMEER